jgi:hypothetical protein
MRYAVLFLFVACMFGCKKQDAPTDLRIKSIRYFRDDTAMGQINYAYSEYTHLLEREDVYYPNYYVRHIYIYQNDSITIQQAVFAGTDTAYETIVIHISGTKHLVSEITSPFKTSTYVYAGERLATSAFVPTSAVKDIVFESGDITAYRVLVANPFSAGGTDTLTNELSYVNRPSQPGINFIPYIEQQALNIPFYPFENTMNLELTGCTFNLHDHLLERDSIHTSSSDVTLDYSYTFDNFGRVTTKTYKSPLLNRISSVRAEYEYFN